MATFPASIRRVAVASVAVLVLGGAAVGIAAAQAQPTPANAQQSSYQKFVAALAQRLNITPQQLQSDITQARQDAGLPANGEGFPGGRGPGGPRGFGGFDPNSAAQAIGIPAQQLQQELPGKSLAQVAQAHNHTAQDVINALTTAADQRIDQAVSSGRITQDQGNTQKSNVAQRIQTLVNQVTPQAGSGNGPRPNGPGGFGGRGGLIGQGLQAAADAIGIPVQQLRQELPGKSLAQVAQAHNHTAQDVINALTTAANQRIDQAVSSGRLTADQGNTDKTNAAQRIQTLVNQAVPQRGNGNGGQQTSGTGA